MTDPTEERTPYRITTAPGQHRLRIDRFLQQALPSISREKIHDLIESGLVLVSPVGSRVPPALVKKSYRIGPNEEIQVLFRSQEPSDVRAEAISLDIVYEDEVLLVVNKPQGMVTHPAHGHFSGTLVNALMHHLGTSILHTGAVDDEDGYGAEKGRPTMAEPTSIRPGIVHRLDKGTSGLLVVAKTELAHRKLTDQFAAREVKRVYRALVWGRFKTSEGTIDAPLGRHPGDRKRFAVVRRGGKIAVTTFRVEEIFTDITHLTLRLKTGRTHQIRAHLVHIGHPIFGDPTYGGRNKRVAALQGSRKSLYESLLEVMPEVALHAETLGFRHPVRGDDMEFAVDPPPAFLAVLKKLRDDSLRNLDNLR